MKKVLITGASDGIGKAIALQLNNNNYQLYLFGRNKEKLEEVVKQTTNVKKAYAFDAHDHNELYKALKEINEDGGVDALVNNMGANLGKQEVKDMDIALFEQMLDINCITHLICIQEVLPSMIKNNKGNIINILSSSCKFDNPTMAAYTASKKAMEAISKTLAKEVKKDNIIVTSVYPGGVDTNFREKKRPDYLRPETIAKQIAFILENDEDGLIQEIITRPIVEENY